MEIGFRHPCYVWQVSEMSRYIIIPYTETTLEIVPYIEDLGEIAGLEELSIVNELLYLWSEHSHNFSPELITYAAQRLSLDLIMSNVIASEDYDSFCSLLYEVMEVIGRHLQQVLGYLNIRLPLTAITFHGEDLVLSYEEATYETYRVA